MRQNAQVHQSQQEVFRSRYYRPYPATPGHCGLSVHSVVAVVLGVAMLTVAIAYSFAASYKEALRNR